ncbi:peptidoglycan bridge formation glycyltransferase FemA/FemB family protein [Paenibacillus sp. JMULE4]|uniref:GNAT family N-acetyltransferase n=1 Tax=Paenibacillus sp. JMULE4 TaxID=2518342 RepID=UPI001575E3BB|nr:GNAT family N-acetyltransferase [Paenibacillus sp. JMULE4]NTZ16378.1 peptidoglycan bridge formation glycyltransferase FemA/FemB family protein [Paenibacillus sp. JMULE4]
MIVKYEEALKIYESFETGIRVPSLHPYYILNDAARDKSLEPIFFVYSEANETFYHGFHLGKVDGTNFYDIQSPYGYGGPISTTADAKFLSNAWAYFLSWASQQSILAEFIRFHPLLENWNFYYGNYKRDRETVWINLMNSDILASFKTRARTSVRKAKKNGLLAEIITDKKDVSSFVEIYQATMQSLDANQFYFFPETYYEKLLEWDKAFIVNCKLQEETVATGLFLCDGLNIEYHLSGSTSTGKELGATNLILYEASIYGKGLGYSKLHLGGGSTPTENNPLLFFKSGFSDERAHYKIGSYIHNEEAYQAMKTEWAIQKGDNNRILFYR